MKLVHDPNEMRNLVRHWRSRGARVGFVPTMGYLHAGHLSLVDEAAVRTDRVVVSIYVNPTQFGQGEDLDSYPRDIERDEDLCREHGVAAVFCPDDAAMYAPDHSTWVVEDSLSGSLCGRSRPGHFRGVTTIVAKLLNIVQPDVAVFGRKDAQQVLVVQRMVRDLNIPVTIVASPIVREADGLAMSSRNKYLSTDERRRAACIYRGLVKATERFESGERTGHGLRSIVADEIRAHGGDVEYIELVSRQSLRAVQAADGPCLLACAVRFGGTRLIDNVFLG